MKKLELKDWDREMCPIMKAVPEIGDKWVLLILRECFFGFNRFEEFQENLGISKSVLTTKLAKMLGDDLLEKVSYKPEKERTRYSYHLTRKGKSLFKIILSLMEWSNKYVIHEGQSTYLAVDKENKDPIKISILNQAGEMIAGRDIEIRIAKKKAE